MIQGVQVIPLKRIPDERGTIFHMLKATDPHFQKFGEIYFSTVYRDVVKGWHLHKKMGLNYVCISGRIKLVLYDGRKGSRSRGEIMELFLSPDSYSLVVIPPNVWNGFKGLADPYSIVANCATRPHDPSDNFRMDPHKNRIIHYDWARKDG